MSDARLETALGAAPSTGARTRPEILAPAGDLECVRAAVENGADAVYFGLTEHNARARASNFQLEELPGLMAELRRRGVRGYVTFNTLVFSGELPSAAATLERLVAAGPDAIIVQDLGILRLLRAISPDVELHASTQATVTCAEEMDLLAELGVSRVILARELSVKEIRKVAAKSPIPVEVFVHGALCVAYSGQCLTSEALGGRSANRGACAQACRLPYDLVVDGQVRDLGERKYLLSPLDLAAIDLVPELVEAGVASLKIEGRLKTPSYVAATVRAYRRAADEAAAGRRATIGREEELELQQVFSRGFSAGFLKGVDHQVLVPALTSKKRGPFVGTVGAVRDRRILATLRCPLKPGDGLAFEAGDPDHEPGGSVTAVRVGGVRVDRAPEGAAAEIELYESDWETIRPGIRIWKTPAPAPPRGRRATGSKPGRRAPGDAAARAAAGRPLEIELGDGVRRASAATSRPLEAAIKRPLGAEYLRGQLARLGETPFELRGLDVRLEGDVIVPVSEINDARRRAAAALEALRAGTPEPRIARGALESIRPATRATAPGTPTTVVLARTMEQLDAVLAAGFREIELDFEDLKKYREAVPRARAAGARIALAPPRIHKPGEEPLLELVASCRPDAVLVRHRRHLDYYRGRAELLGDSSLNIANDLAADWFLARGLAAFAPSHDLSVPQLEALLARVPADRAELVVHLRMPMFHLEHCVFAATLSTGHDASDCGRPCDRHRVALRDRVGMAHPLKADVGCRNTVFNAVPQSASPYVARLQALGVRRFRVELLEESGEEAARIATAYRDLLEGRRDGATLWRELKASNVVGVTRGPLGRD